MKTAIIYGPRDIQVEEVDIPVIGPDDVLVRVKVSGICGSDVHRYLGTEYGRGYYNYPMNSGHEYCGDVVQVGNRVKEFREGRGSLSECPGPAASLEPFPSTCIYRTQTTDCVDYPRRLPIPMAH